MRPLIAAILTSLALAAGAPARADTVPQGGGADNVVLSSTTSDGAFVSHAHTQVAQTGGISVASSNIARATASTCTGCHATAVAVQAVVFSGSPRYYTPANAAVAWNGGCNACGTYAYAWQYLVQVDRPFTLSGDAQARIRELRTQIAETADATVPDSLDADALLDLELNGLTSRLREVIDEGVTAAGAHVVAPPVERAAVDNG